MIKAKIDEYVIKIISSYTQKSNLQEVKTMHLKHYQFILLFIITSLTFISCDQPINSSQQQEINSDSLNQNEFTTASSSIDNQYIVVLKSDDKLFDPGLNLTDEIDKLINSVINDINLGENGLLFTYTNSLKGFAAKLNEEQLQKLRDDSRVSYIESDQTVSLIPPLPLPGLTDTIPHSEPEQSVPYGIIRVGGPFNGLGMTTWVIDTGVDLDHDDLNVDRDRSRSFVLTEPTIDDLNGHGTHVAGTIAAIDNEINVVGVAAGATIVSVKVLSALGLGTNSGVIAGIDYVAQNASPGDTANMSLGGSSSEALDDAVRNAADQGILFAIAAGNDSEHSGNYSPARVEHENTWTVSAVDKNDIFASFSNYGNPPVRYSAPGVNIESLWFNNSTHTISGTSMASPHVAGILLISHGHPDNNGSAIDDPDGTPDPIVFFNE